MKASIIGKKEKKTAIHGENVVVATSRKFASARKIHKSQNRREMNAATMVIKKSGMKKVNMNKALLPSMSSRAAASMMQSAMVIIASKTAKNLSERSSFSPFEALFCINRPFCTIYKRCMMDFLCSHYKISLDPSPITTFQGQDDACSDTVRNDVPNLIPNP